MVRFNPPKWGKMATIHQTRARIRRLEQRRRVGKKRGGERGSYMGSPHHLKEKIAKTRDEKREKTIDTQIQRKDGYLKDRKKGVKKNRQMEEVKEASNLASVQVKKAQLEDSSSPIKAIDLTKDIEGKQMELAIDLTRELKPKATIKKNIGNSKKESKERKKKEAAALKKAKAARVKKEKKVKDGKIVSGATKSMIDVTKGIGRAK